MGATLKQKIGQILFIGVQGHTLSDDEKKFIVENNIGGVTLFSRNIESTKQVHALNMEIQNLRHRMVDKAPLFIAVDMEGGRVARFKSPFTQWPPMRTLGDLDSATLGFKFAETMGHELHAIGVNVNFAPSVDVLTNPKNEIIGDRALGTDSERVGKVASSIVRGFIKSDIIPCAKHFPGHGNTLIDSHVDLPVENEIDLKRLLEVELPPFKRAFRARLDLVMTGHIKFPKIDPEWPVTFSEIFLKDILRKQLGYRNLIITDDLDMKALANHYPAEFIPVRSLQAGNDILLYCNEPAKPPVAIAAIEKAVTDGKLAEEIISERHNKIINLKKKIRRPEPLDMAEVAKILGHPDHLKLSKAIATGQIPEDLQT
jgi:beta-N-acetylhexosaminidase